MLVFAVFFDEVIGTLERAITENIGMDNLVLEINSLKLVHNSPLENFLVLIYMRSISCVNFK